MRFFLLAFLVSATPVLAQSLPGQQASRLVLLAGEAGQTGQAGQGGPKVLALPPPPPPTPNMQLGEDPFAPVYRRLSSMQLQLLEFQRVSIAAPMTVMLFGVTGAAVGVTMLVIGAVSYGFFIVGLIVLGVSSLPLLIGIPWLVGTTSTNARVTREIEKVKREQRQLGNRPIESADGAVLGTF